MSREQQNFVAGGKNYENAHLHELSTVCIRYIDT